MANIPNNIVAILGVDNAGAITNIDPNLVFNKQVTTTPTAATVVTTPVKETKPQQVVVTNNVETTVAFEIDASSNNIAMVNDTQDNLEDSIIWQFAKKVGIGTKSPNWIVDVKGGSINVSPVLGTDGFKIKDTNFAYADFSIAGSEQIVLGNDLLLPIVNLHSLIIRGLIPITATGKDRILFINDLGVVSAKTDIFLESMNGLTNKIQVFAIGTSGVSPNIVSTVVSTVGTHTFNFPLASTTGVTAGLISKADYDDFFGKVAGSGTINYLSKFSTSKTLTNSLIYDNGTNVTINGTSGAGRFNVVGTSVFYGNIVVDNLSNLSIGQSNTINIPAVGYSVFDVTNYNFDFLANTGGLSYRWFRLDTSNLANQTLTIFTLPASSGTLALLSDIPSLAGYVQNTRTLTINGTTFDLSANRTWSVGTVTSVAALTIGTTGTDISSTVDTNTTTPVITLNIPTASATNRGALSSADWTTFNNKQSALTNPITGTGTTNYVPKFTAASALGNSTIYDSGTAVGIKTASPVASLEVNGASKVSGGEILSYTQQLGNTVSTNYVGSLVQAPDYTNATTSSASYYGTVSSIGAVGSNTGAIVVFGGIFFGRAYNTSTGQISVTGIAAFATRNNASDISTNANNNLVGASINVGHQGSITTAISTSTAYGILNNLTIARGTVTTLIGQYISPSIGVGTNNTALVTTFYGLRIGALVGATSGTGTGTITSYYDLYLEGTTVQATGTVTNKWGVYQTNSAHANYFAGAVLIGTTTNAGYALDVTGTFRATGAITGNSFIKSGGTSSQFLKADGTIDSSVYLTGITYSQVIAAIGYTPYDSANPNGYTTNVGTVTSVAALTIGTIGTDVSSTVATSTTTPVITLNIPTASATNRGALSSADWTTFNNKQNTVSLTTTGSSGAATLISSVLNIPIYTLSGLGGEPAITAGTTSQYWRGDKTWQTLNTTVVTESTNLYYTQARFDSAFTAKSTTNLSEGTNLYFTLARVRATDLSGLNVTGGSVVSTDTVLQAFGKIQNQLNTLSGSVIYQGVWNASTNTPSLTSSSGTKGYYYKVSVAGSTALDGISDWNIGDWVIYNGTTWDKIDNTDSVSSVNGFTGAVSLTTSNISEGTNLYYTDARVRASLSFVAGSGGYNSTTGVMTIPTNTSHLTNGANFITLLSLSASAPLSYNNTTGTFTISQANSTTNGYLSSTDWNTFNNKQNVLTNPITGSLTTNYISKATGATTLGDSTIYESGGSVGIGTTALTEYSLRVSKNITGATTAYGLRQDGVVQSDVTGTVYGFINILNTQATAFTISQYVHYSTGLSTIGAGSVITNQYGFFAGANLTSATNNYGFYGDIANATGRWNLYMAGTALNYLAGNLLIKSTTDNGNALQVTGAANITSTLTIGSSRPIVFDGSLGSVTIKANAGGWVTGTFFQGSSGTSLGGFGAFGGTDALNYFYIGTSQTTNGIRVYPTTNNVLMSGNVGIGAVSSVASLSVSKNITGGLSAFGITQGGVVQSDVTTGGHGFYNTLNTQATAFTLSVYRHFYADNGTIGAGSTVNNQYGFIVSDLTGATNNYGFWGALSNGTGKWNLYMNGTANNYLAGNLGIGTTTLTTTILSVSKGVTGGTIASAIVADGSILSDVTSIGIGFGTFLNTQQATFTLGSYRHFHANQGAIRTGSVVSEQIGFYANSNLSGATNNYGFAGYIPSGASNWNIYMAGTANNYLAGALGIGSTSLTGFNFRVNRNITGSVLGYGGIFQGTIQSDVTTQAFGVMSSHGTQATAWTLPSYSAFYVAQGTIGAGSVITNQYGFHVDSSNTGATNNYAFFSNIASGTGRWNLYMNGTANNYMAGSLGIGTTTLTAISLNIQKTITGATTAYGFIQQGQVQSDVTASANGILNSFWTQASTFTLTNYRHFYANQSTIGAGSTVTNQYGFFAESNIVGATNNYGFYGNLPSGTGRWNIYMVGTAPNYLAGNLGIGATPSSTISLLLNKTFTGATNYYSIQQYNTINSDVTNAVYNNYSQFATQSATFNLSNIYNFYIADVSVGAGSTITNHYGYFVNNLAGATNNYGFYGNIANGTGRWNLYMNGTANNYLAGNLLIGTTVDGGYKLNVTGTAYITSALTANSFVKISGTSSQYLMADGSVSTITDAFVTGKLLTGYTTLTGTVSATDTILQAFGKVQSQLNGLSGSLIYKGSWNASTNSPTIVSGTGTNGNYYIVSVAGTTTIDGISSWAVGDWIVFNSTTGTWQKIANQSVTSVNGLTGVVTITTTNITEGTNLYYTNARVITAPLTGYTSGAGTITAADTILSSIQKLNGNISALVTGVSSVNTLTGAVTLTTSNISEGTNLYYTNARGISSTLTGYASTTGTISASDTVLSAIQKLNGNFALISSIFTGTSAQFVKANGTTNEIVTDLDANITGSRNSSNTLFTISANFVSNSTRVFVNGIRMQRGVSNDYVEVGTNQIQFTVAPDSGDIIVVDYIK